MVAGNSDILPIYNLWTILLIRNTSWLEFLPTSTAFRGNKKSLLIGPLLGRLTSVFGFKYSTLAKMCDGLILKRI